MTVELRTPTLDMLPYFADALKRGWSPDSRRMREFADEQLAAIEQDDAAFIARQTDPEAKGAPITLPDGSKIARIPGRHFWIWDDAFCGELGLRWLNGSADLPPHVLGHIGYNVVPWKRRQGCATAALRLVLPHARALGLPYVEITTDPDNTVSQKVITANGGVLIESFTKAAAYGGTPGLRFRIPL